MGDGCFVQNFSGEELIKVNQGLIKGNLVVGYQVWAAPKLDAKN